VNAAHRTTSARVGTRLPPRLERFAGFVRDLEKAYFASPASRVFATLMRRRARHLYERVIADVGPLEPGQRIADVGCGHGTFLVMYQQRNPLVEALGVDQSAALVEYARKQGEELGASARFEVGAVEDDPLPRDAFDVVVSCSSIYLWLDPARALTHLHDALVPGGRLLVYDQLPPKSLKDIGKGLLKQQVYGLGFLGWSEEELLGFARDSAFGGAQVETDGVIVTVRAERRR
jgi:SAM-dependent methyltransferase